MIPSHRQRFNRDYTDAKHSRFLELLEARCGEPVQFRHSETPCFLPGSLVSKLARYGREMVEQLLGNPQYQKDSVAAVPADYRVPNEDPRPLFVQADFGLDAALQPQLVEIQGFPTLYCYQPLLAESYREAYGIDDALSALPEGLNASEYRTILREAIVGNHDPKNVVLLEIDPAHQKTRHDFLMTEQAFGVATVDITSVVKQGKRLFYRDGGGALVPVERIYNRAIVDELVRRQIPMASTSGRAGRGVGRAPNWFFRLSKFSLPYRSRRGTENALPERRERGGRSRTRLEAAVASPARALVGPTGNSWRRCRRSEKPVHPAAARGFPAGDRYAVRATKIEIRIMYVWLDRLRAVNTIIRMGRGSADGRGSLRALQWSAARRRSSTRRCKGLG